MDFKSFETRYLIVIVGCLSKALNTEKSRLFKEDVITVLKLANDELAERINKFGKDLEDNF